MSYFSNQLWEDITRPFKIKSNGENRKWVAVLGSLMDDAKKSILEIRRQWIIKHSVGWVLDIRGDERGLPRWYDENDNDYRKRVQAAFALYAAGGTLPGMKRALRQIGYGDVPVTERSGPTWAHFLLSFDFPLDKTMGRREWDMLHYTVRLIKPAHTFPLYLMRFTTSEQSIKPDNKIKLLLTNHTAHYFYGNRSRYYPLDGCVLLDGFITLGDWMTLQVLDGGLLLDGKSLLDGYTQYGANEPHIVRIKIENQTKHNFWNNTGVYPLDGSIALGKWENIRLAIKYALKHCYEPFKQSQSMKTKLNTNQNFWHNRLPENIFGSCTFIIERQIKTTLGTSNVPGIILSPETKTALSSEYKTKTAAAINPKINNNPKFKKLNAAASQKTQTAIKNSTFHQKKHLDLKLKNPLLTKFSCKNQAKIKTILPRYYYRYSNNFMDGIAKMDGHLRLDGQQLQGSILFMKKSIKEERCEIL